MIRETCPYSNVIMIGDGITDLEAVQVRRDEAIQVAMGAFSNEPIGMRARQLAERHHPLNNESGTKPCLLTLLPPSLSNAQVSGGADLFIGYGGVIARPMVEAEADWFVTDYAELEASMKRYKVRNGERGGERGRAARALSTPSPVWEPRNLMLQ